jgi:hypothetical protein
METSRSARVRSDDGGDNWDCTGAADGLVVRRLADTPPQPEAWDRPICRRSAS